MKLALLKRVTLYLNPLEMGHVVLVWKLLFVVSSSFLLTSPSTFVRLAPPSALVATAKVWAVVAHPMSRGVSDCPKSRCSSWSRDVTSPTQHLLLNQLRSEIRQFMISTSLQATVANQPSAQPTLPTASTADSSSVKSQSSHSKMTNFSIAAIMNHGFHSPTETGKNF